MPYDDNFILGTSDKETQTENFVDSILQSRFTPEEDLRLLDAVNTCSIKHGPNKHMRINWQCIKILSKVRTFQKASVIFKTFNKFGY